MRLQLINSPLPNSISSCLRSKCYPPLNLISIATHVKNEIPDIKLDIIDGEIMEQRKLLNLINSDIVGISSNSLSYRSAVLIAQHIKEKNPKCTVILGGAHATHMWERILTKRNCFDILVIGQGEYAVVDILKKRELKNIPNIAYFDRNSNEIKKNSILEIPINSLPLPDYSIINLANYHKNFQINYSDKEELNGIPVYSSTGCKWRIKTGGCIYCSIPNKNFSLISPSKYWDYIQKMNDKFNIDFFWDVSDTFTSDDNWVNEVLDEKPKNLNVSFHVYARVDDLSVSKIKKLKLIGMKEVLVGIESFNNKMLNSAKKGFTYNKIKTVLKELNKQNVKVALSFVLGLPGESANTLEDTYNRLLEINWMNNVIENHASILIPLPGSRIFDELMEKEYFQNKYGKEDLINLTQFQIDYLEKFTKCKAKEIFEYFVKIENVFKSGGPFFLDKSNAVYEKINYRELFYSK
jgi:radical SAM superfamily enzyme YgiQ (UPF0313 family)